MKNKVFALAILAMGFSAKSFAQTTSTASNVDAKAIIVKPISIEKLNNMSFGNIATNGAEGNVVLNPDGSRTATNGITITNNKGIAASFIINGEAGSAYTVVLPATVELTSGANIMVVDNFTSDQPALNGSNQTLNVGATLKVGASQASGTYAGTFDVTVAYN